MRGLRQRGLTWKLYWVGLAQLAVVLAAAVLTSISMARYWARWDLPAVMDRVEPVASRPAELAKKLRELRDAGGPELSVYDQDRTLVASNVEPPLSLPEKRGEPRGQRPRRSPPGPLDSLMPWLIGEPPRGPFKQRQAAVHLTLERGEGTLVMRRARDGVGPWPLLLTLLSGAAVVGLGAALTARFVVRPLLNVEKELMANVAHELRTPLSRIRVALEIAGEGDAATARASLEEIGVDLAELETLLDDVLTTARLELTGGSAHGSNLPLNLKPISVRELVEHSAARFRSRHPDRTLEVALDPGLPELTADAVLLRRALDNLLENAAKYSPDVGKPIGLRAQARPRVVRLEVQDQGIGIAPPDLLRVFTPFFRAERSRTRSAGGVGLGLTLSKQIAEAHGGTIGLLSSLGAGTTARLDLPLTARTPAAPVAAAGARLV